MKQTTNRIHRAFPVLLVLCLGLLPALSNAATRTVTKTADDGTPGTLRREIADAAAQDIIVFDPALFDPDLSEVTITLTMGEIVIGKDLGIDGSGLPGGITISGADASRVFYVSNNSNVAMESLTIAEGHAPDRSGSTGGDDGGGILVENSTLTLQRCTIAHNRAGDSIGGGDGGDGGGIAGFDSVLILEQCTVAHNRAGDGIGGVPFAVPGGLGGGIRCAGTGSLNLDQCTIVENQAGTGSDGNGAGGDGGGIHVQSGGPTALSIERSILARNHAGPGGGSGPDGRGPDLNTNPPPVSRVSLIGDNTLDDGNPSTAFPEGPTVGTGASPLDPILGDLADNGGPTQTFLPLTGSPAIDPAGGEVTPPFPTDQRGFSRISNGILDIGAVEVSVPLIVTTLADNKDTPPDGSLRKAIVDATMGTTITFDDGLVGQITLDGMELTIDKSLTIDASSVPGGIVISGNDLSRVFRVEAGNTVLMKSLTIAAGRAPDGVAGVDEGFGGLGGGILNEGVLTLEKCTVSSCRAGDGEGNIGEGGYGGGIHNFEGILTLKECIVSDNRAGDAGSGGFGGFGGGIYNWDGILTLEKCTVSGNLAGGGAYGGYGGGISNDETLTVKQSTIVNNRAGNGESDEGGGGGGIYSSTNLILEQSTIANNRAGDSSEGDGGEGGGINLEGGSSNLSISHCIIAGNFPGMGGSGGSNGEGADLDRDVETTRDGVNLIGDNTLDGGAESTVFPSPGTPGEPNANGDLVGTSEAPLDPLLGPLADNGGLTRTMLPLRGSPAIDPPNGATSSPFATDQGGFARIVGGILDIGAVEAPDYATIDAAAAVAEAARAAQAAAAAQANAAARAAQLADFSKKIKKLKKKAKDAKRKGQASKAKKLKKQIKKLTKQMRAL